MKKNILGVLSVAVLFVCVFTLSGCSEKSKFNGIWKTEGAVGEQIEFDGDSYTRYILFDGEIALNGLHSSGKYDVSDGKITLYDKTGKGTTYSYSFDGNTLKFDGKRFKKS